MLKGVPVKGNKNAPRRMRGIRCEWNEQKGKPVFSHAQAAHSQPGKIPADKAEIFLCKKIDDLFQPELRE